MFRISYMRLYKISYVRLLSFGLFFTALYLFYSIYSLKTSNKKIYDLNIGTELNQKHEGMSGLTAVHLDFKGGAPTYSFFSNLLKLLSIFGSNHLILEYEEMFPYSGILSNISSKAAYTLPEIKAFKRRAQQENISIIPYVPIINNLEFILKTRQFQYLREFPPSPQVISPCLKSLDLIKQLISQILKVHNDSKYIILGGEKIDLCLNCVTNNYKKFLFIYIREVVNWIKNKYSVTVVISHWMINKEFVSKSLAEVEPMILCNSRNEDNDIDLNKIPFKKIWIGGFFRGHSTRNRLFPDLNETLSIQKSCMERFGKADVQGYILMGKSRKDHFSTLTELLPVSIPSLIMNLIYVKNQIKTCNLERILNCKTVSNNKLTGCRFPGYDLFNKIISFDNLKHEITTSVQYFEQQGWFTAYNIDYNLTNPHNLIKYTPKMYSLFKRIGHIKKILYGLLWRYTDKYATFEWIIQNVVPLEKSLTRVLEEIDRLLKQDVWDGRPE